MEPTLSAAKFTRRTGIALVLRLHLLIMDSWWANALWSITPTVLIGLFFAGVLRMILRADRTERRIYQEMEAEERARLGLPPKEEK